MPAILICDCGQQLNQYISIERLEEALKKLAPEFLTFHSSLCSENGKDCIDTSLKKYERLVIAACNRLDAFLPPDKVISLTNIKEQGFLLYNEKSFEPILHSITSHFQKAILMSPLSPSRFAFHPEVLIIGNGNTARLISQKLTENNIRHLKLETYNRVDIKGHIGNYEVSTDENVYRFGAIIIAQDTIYERNLLKNAFTYTISRFMTELKTIIELLRHKTVCFFINNNYAANKLFLQDIFTISREIKLKKRSCAIYIILPYVYLTAGFGMNNIEKEYKTLRDMGIIFIKYQKIPEFEFKKAIEVTVEDTLSMKILKLQPDYLVAAETVLPQTSPVFKEYVYLDNEGFYQINNINLFPVLTNKKGIFVVGGAKGYSDQAETAIDVNNVVLEIDKLLNQTGSVVYNIVPEVNKDKCVLCLTCIRSCPYKAIEIDKEKNIAKPDSFACASCGICSSICPAKAINLPNFYDEQVFAEIAVM